MAGKNNAQDTGEGLVHLNLGRRRFIQQSGIALGGATVFGTFLAACGDDESSSGDTGAGEQPTTTTTERPTTTTSEPAAPSEPIKIGFLTAFTGLEAILGETQFNCFELAVKQVNAAGGIAGRQIEFIREDDQTDSTATIERANKLALKDEVTAIIGLITSLEREAALTTLPQEQVPLIYTTYYEGAAAGANACDPYLVATGQVPNQQIEPLVPWLTENVGTSYMVIGSDYIWPRGTTEVLEELVAAEGGEVMSASYFPFGTADFGPFIQDLENANPDICWVTLAGSDFQTFLQQYAQFGATPRLVSIGMDDVFSRSAPGVGVGAICSQAYFMSIDSPENRAFLEAYRADYGVDAPVNAIGEAAYNAVFLMKAAIEAADGDTDPGAWLPKLGEVSIDAPSGRVGIDPTNQHTISNSYLGRVLPDGTIEIITSQESVVPQVTGCALA